MPAIPVPACERDGCDEPVAVLKHRLCAAHYAGLRRAGKLTTASYGREIAPRACLKCGRIFEPVRANHRHCGPMCQNAAGQERRYLRRQQRDAEQSSTPVAPDLHNSNRSSHAR